MTMTEKKNIMEDAYILNQGKNYDIIDPVEDKMRIPELYMYNVPGDDKIISVVDQNLLPEQEEDLFVGHNYNLIPRVPPHNIFDENITT